MTVALGIDIGMKAGAGEPGGVAGATKGAALLGVSGSGASHGSPASGAQSFHRNWQSLLASLGMTEDGGNEAGASSGTRTGEGKTAGETALAQTALISGQGAGLPEAWPTNDGDLSGSRHGLTSVSAAENTAKSLRMQIRAETAAAKPSGQTILNGSTASKAHTSKGEHATGEASHSAKGHAIKKDSKTPVAGAAHIEMNAPVPVTAPVAITNAQPKAANISDSHPDADLPSLRSEISVPLAASGASAAMSKLHVAVDGGSAGKSEVALLRKTTNEGQNAAAVGASADLGTDPEIDSAKAEAVEARSSGQLGSISGLQGSAGASVAQARLQTGTAHVSERSSVPGEPKADGTSTQVAAMAGGAAQSPDAGAPTDLPVPGVSSNAASVVSAGGRHSTGQAAVAAARVSTVLAEREKHVGEGQTTGTGVDASVLGRDPGGTRGIANTIHGNGSPAANAAPASGHNTFAALDAGTNADAPSWVHAGAQHAEAGFQDPSLGWVSVRANVSGGAIHAALVPGSSDAAQALAGHLAGLNNHLATEHMAVHPVTVAAPTWNSGQGAAHQGSHQGSYQGSGQGSYQGSSGGAGQHSGQGGYAQPYAGTTLVPARMAGPVTAVPAHAAVSSSGGGVAGRGGAYISVIA